MRPPSAPFRCAGTSPPSLSARSPPPSSRPARTCGRRGGWWRRRPTPVFAASCPSWPYRSAVHPGGRLEVDPAPGRFDPGDPHAHGAAHPDPAPRGLADQRRLGLVEREEVLAAQAAGRQESLEDVAELAAEGDEGSRADHPGHLAGEALLAVAVLAQLALEQESRADVIR